MTVEEFKAKYGGGPGVTPAPAEKPVPSGRSSGATASRQIKAGRDIAASGSAPADTSPVEPPPSSSPAPDYGPSADLMPDPARIPAADKYSGGPLLDETPRSAEEVRQQQARDAMTSAIPNAAAYTRDMLKRLLVEPSEKLRSQQ